MTHSIGLIPEDSKTRATHGRRLGRHIHFDERSKSFRVSAPTSALVTKIWPRSVPPLDQGDTGSCTGNGAVGVLATAPFFKTGVTYDETLARKVYSEASKIDSIHGDWPPTDTGSTVICAMKAAQKLGFIKSYHWCLGLSDVLATLSHLGPVEVGVSWYSGFDQPAADGLVRISGMVEGGHAFELHGIDVAKKLVWAYNSWGSSWGLQGRFCFSFDTLGRLMKEHGEAVLPIA